MSLAPWKPGRDPSHDEGRHASEGLVAEVACLNALLSMNPSERRILASVGSWVVVERYDLLQPKKTRI